MDREPSERLPGADAEPLSPLEQARWDAVAAHAADAADALSQGDAEGFAAAFEALGQGKVDLQKVLNALHVPDDAGEWAPALERILRRVPDGWGRWIRCGPGWYPIVVRLDERLADIDPEYVVLQVKEKYGGLRFYAEPSPARCCAAWEADHPLPPSSSSAEPEGWEQAFEAHHESAEHAAGDRDRQRRQAAMDAAIAAAEAEAAVTCELTGAPGRLMVSGAGWYCTLAPDVGAATGYRAVG